MKNAGAEETVLAGYLETNEALLTLLRRTSQPRSRFLKAHLALREAFGAAPEAWAGALRLAESAAGEEVPPDLYLLFLADWALISRRARRLDEASVLLNRAKGLIRKTTPPLVVARVLGIEGYLASAAGNMDRRLEVAREILALVPPETPRYRKTIWNRAIHLARLGRGAEAEADLEWLAAAADPAYPLWRIGIPRFVNAVETGCVEEAAHHLAAIPPGNADEAYSIQVRRVILDLMRGEWSWDMPAGPPPDSLDRRLLPHEEAAAMKRLLDRRVEEALAWSRIRLAGIHRAVAGITFCSFNLLRAELAAGHVEVARRIMDHRHAGGFHHYLDDLFLARADLLSGDLDGAAHRYRNLEDAIRRYGAEGRLEFELRMACEIAPAAMARLIRRVEAIAAPAPPPAAPRPAPAPSSEPLRGPSQALAVIRREVLRFAPLEVPVLITGETGTGKEILARTLHEASPRSREPFVAVNCGAIAETLLEAELFGYERGAFTGAERARQGLFDEAGRGTLFLDEIGDISPRLQVVLLRVLETREVRPVGASRSHRTACRVVAATNAPLDQRVAHGQFRRDLLFRMRRLVLHLPPLRERREDILPLAAHFLDLGRPPGARAAMSPELREALLRHDWPGNVRELRNEIERMRLFASDGARYDIVDLDPRIRRAAAPPPSPRASPDAGDQGASRETVPEKAAPLVDLSAAEAPAEARRARLADLFARHERLTRKAVAEALGVSLPTATADLKALWEKGQIEKVKPSAAPRTHYFLRREAARCPGEASDRPLSLVRFRHLLSVAVPDGRRARLRSVIEVDGKPILGGAAGLAGDLCALSKSARRGGTYRFLKCPCGAAECDRNPAPIRVAHVGGKIRWRAGEGGGEGDWIFGLRPYRDAVRRALKEAKALMRGIGPGRREG